MTDVVEELVAKKPHLKDTLRFYQNSLHFINAVQELRISVRPELNAYPPELTGEIVHRFASIFSLPDGALNPLQQALELGEIDFRRLPLLEVPAFSLPYPEDDLTMILFLIGKPFFIGMRELSPVRKGKRRKGHCSLCGARPSLMSRRADDLYRLHCSFCGTVEQNDPAGCSACRSQSRARSSMFSFHGEEGFTFQTCDVCKSYRKVVDGELLASMTPDLADIISLPMDVAIQDKGYKRTSPNPLGMVRMSAKG
jgi:FdhE protein